MPVPRGPNRKKLWRPVEGTSRDLGYMVPFYDVKRDLQSRFVNFDAETRLLWVIGFQASAVTHELRSRPIVTGRHTSSGALKHSGRRGRFHERR